MYRGTTPEICIMLDTELDMADVEEIWVTFRSFVRSSTYTMSGGEVNLDPVMKRMYIRMTQEETLSYRPGKMDVQARILFDNGNAVATDVCKVDVSDILLGGVIRKAVEDGSPDPNEPAG